MNIRRLTVRKPPPGTTTRPARFLAATGLTAALAATLALTGCSSDTDSGSAPYPTYTGDASTAAPAGPDLPDGFTDGDNGLAFKSPGKLTDACSLDIGSCFQVLVYAYQDCSVYLEANGLDSGGTVIDYSNDTATLAPGDTALLTFQFTTLDVDTVKFTKAECN